MKMFLLRVLVVCGVCFGTLGHVGSAAMAQSETPEAEKPVAPRSLGTPLYEDKLLRLAEILGSLQYLRTLCSTGDETAWRSTMENLLEVETAEEPLRREKLTAAYNRGFRTFASVHTACSDTAIEAETRYRREGETLTADILARYGN